MTELMPANDWIRMRDNVRRAVSALEVCWRCQRVSECQKYVLGNLVLVWLCGECLGEMEQPQLSRNRRRSRVSVRE
jgi:hypothetical protein